MKILEYIASQTICLAEHNRLTAWLRRAQTPLASDIMSALRRASDDDSDDDPDSMWDDFDAAIYPPRPKMQVNEPAGFAVIPVHGMITQGLSVFEQRYFGCCDVDSLGDMVDACASNTAIQKVIFDHDSPGGYIGGVPELTEKIAALTAGKTTVAFTRGTMCSASYWLASACGTIACTPSSVLGSIGVYCTYVDMSKMADEMGIKVQVFSSGKYKGMGEPGTSLTPDQAALMQAKIDKSATQFKSSVLEMRPNIPATAMEGQWFDGDECVALGMADDLVDDMSDVMP